MVRHFCGAGGNATGWSHAAGTSPHRGFGLQGNPAGRCPPEALPRTPKPGSPPRASVSEQAKKPHLSGKSLFPRTGRVEELQEDQGASKPTSAAATPDSTTSPGSSPEPTPLLRRPPARPTASQPPAPRQHASPSRPGRSAPRECQSPVASRLEEFPRWL